MLFSKSINQYNKNIALITENDKKISYSDLHTNITKIAKNYKQGLWYF